MTTTLNALIACMSTNTFTLQELLEIREIYITNFRLLLAAWHNEERENYPHYLPMLIDEVTRELDNRVDADYDKLYDIEREEVETDPDPRQVNRAINGAARYSQFYLESKKYLVVKPSELRFYKKENHRAQRRASKALCSQYL